MSYLDHRQGGGGYHDGTYGTRGFLLVAALGDADNPRAGGGYCDNQHNYTYAYNRLGQLSSVTDAAGTREFVYDPSKPWRLASAAFDEFHDNRVFIHLYDTTGVIGRMRGLQLGATAGSASDLQQIHSFSADGRFDTIVSQRNGSSGTNRTFDYGYFTNSALLGSAALGYRSPAGKCVPLTVGFVQRAADLLPLAL